MSKYKFVQIRGVGEPERHEGERLPEVGGVSPRCGELPDEAAGTVLSARQELVLRALVTAYVGEAAPVGSQTIAHLVPVRLSAASIRNTMADLAELGLLEKPHRSSGRVPTELGLRVFVDRLVGHRDLVEYEKRDLADVVEDAAPEALMRVASRVLSERTRQLGFALAPRLEGQRLRRLVLVRLSARRVLAVLVLEAGVAERRVIEHDESDDPAELDRICGLLNERLEGRTLGELRRELREEARALRSSATRAAERAVRLGVRALAVEPAVGDLVIATRLALLDQPEFQDPERIRRLFAALETREALLRVLDRLLAASGVRVDFGEELGEPELRCLALVTAPYGVAGCPLGLVGVIGPTRMDYARIIPLVDYLSKLVTERFCT